VDLEAQLVELGGMLTLASAMYSPKIQIAIGLPRGPHRRAASSSLFRNPRMASTFYFRSVISVTHCMIWTTERRPDAQTGEMDWQTTDFDIRPRPSR